MIGQLRRNYPSFLIRIDTFPTAPSSCVAASFPDPDAGGEIWLRRLHLFVLVEHRILSSKGNAGKNACPTFNR